MIAALTESERQAALASLPDWAFDPARRAIHRRVWFETFGEALGAIVRIGLEAEKADHHPEWANCHAQLDIWLTSHDAGGLSQRDVDFARAVDRIVGEPR